MNAQTVVTHAFTIDVEDWYHGTNYLYENIRESKRLDYGLNLLLELLAEHNIRATFLWLGKAAEENSTLLKKVASLGHEIGCHGWHHTPVCNMSRNQFKRETYHALSLLSDLTSQQIAVYRAPYFSITSESLWALQILAELGIRYDSSIFPLKKGDYGIPNFTQTIHDISTQSGAITEIPISINKVFGVSLPASGGGFFRFYPFGLTYWNFLALEKMGRPVIFYIHPWELDPWRPSGQHSFRERLRNQIGIKSTEGKIKRLLGKFSFSTLSKVAMDFQDTHSSQCLAEKSN